MSIDHRFCINLFDFVVTWKIDIPDFMNESYKDQLTLRQMALFTERSLAAFKCGFKAASDHTPQRCITHRRLQEAYRFITDIKESPQTLHLELRFKSISHFSIAFKKHSIRTME